MISPRVASILERVGRSQSNDEIPTPHFRRQLFLLAEVGLIDTEYRGRPGINRRKYYSLTPAGLAALRLYNDTQ